MIQTTQTSRKNRRIAAVLIALLLLLGCTALASEAELPEIGEHRADAVAEDFFGSWYLRWIHTENAVDLQAYGFIDLYPNGAATVCFGDALNETYYTASYEDLGNGCLFVSDEINSGLYLFLCDDLMICVDQPDNPEIVYYMEYSGKAYMDEAVDDLLQDLILEHIGEQFTDAAREDFQGSWRAFTCTNDNGALFPLYMIDSGAEILIAGEQATVSTSFAEEETTYESPVLFEAGLALIQNEDSSAPHHLLLCADGRLVLTDDPDAPSFAIFFITADHWEAEMANVDYDANPQPGEQIPLDSLDLIAGEWEATYINYGGTMYATLPLSYEAGISIDPEEEIFLFDGYEYVTAEAQLEDGLLTLTDNVYGYETYYFYHDGDWLIQTDDLEDRSVLVYYQRVAPTEEY